MPRIEDGATRAFAAVVVLIVVWIVVYWVTPPGGRGDESLRFQEAASAEPEASRDTASADEPLTFEEPASVVDPAGASPALEDGGVIPPSFRDYTTRDGDSFESIAEQYYGSRARWPVVAQANPLVDPNRLRPGRVLRLPVDPNNIEGVVAGSDDPPAPPEPKVVEYTVSRGDTLGAIAKRYYGSTRYTDFLFRANRDRLRSPESIRLGQVLVIPPKPADVDE